jgi:hypothetical protein
MNITAVITILVAILCFGLAGYLVASAYEDTGLRACFLYFGAACWLYLAVMLARAL